jgi:hypothetical protein
MGFGQTACELSMQDFGISLGLRDWLREKRCFEGLEQRTHAGSIATRSERRSEAKPVAD